MTKHGRVPLYVSAQRAEMEISGEAAAEMRNALLAWKQSGKAREKKKQKRNNEEKSQTMDHTCQDPAIKCCPPTVA